MLKFVYNTSFLMIKCSLSQRSCVLLLTRMLYPCSLLRFRHRRHHVVMNLQNYVCFSMPRGERLSRMSQEEIAILHGI